MATNDNTTPADFTFPGVPFERAVLRVVVSGGAECDDEDERQAAQHFAVLATHPDEVDRTGNGPGGIIADIGQFPEAERYARLFAAAPRLRRASQELHDRVRDFLDVPDRALPYGLVTALDGVKAAWRDADEPTAEPRPYSRADAERTIWWMRRAADRDDARLRDSFRRYFSLHDEEKIRLAMEILEDVSAGWDHDTLEHYPAGLGSFDEFLLDLRVVLGAIRWTRPGRSPAQDDGTA